MVAPYWADGSALPRPTPLLRLPGREVNVTCMPFPPYRGNLGEADDDRIHLDLDDCLQPGRMARCPPNL
jgi:hypothetical protein